MRGTMNGSAGHKDRAAGPVTRTAGPRQRGAGKEDVRDVGRLSKKLGEQKKDHVRRSSTIGAAGAR